MLRPEFTNHKNDLIVQLNDWTESDVVIDEDDSSSSDGENGGKKKWFKEKEYVIKAYGITEEGHSISIDFKGFQPFFFVRVPDGWTRNSVKLFKMQLEERVNKYSRKALIKFTVIKRIPYYGFCNYEKSFFIKLVFKNLSGFYSYRKAVRESSDNPIRVSGEDYDFGKLMYESNITPMLRFFHSKNIKPVGWIKLPFGKYSMNYPKTTRCQIDCSMHYMNVEPIDLDKIGKFVVASYDIECTSCDGTFPNETRPEDKIIQIGTTINIFGSDKIHKYIATLKKCDEIESTTVEEFENEKDLVIGWCRFIKNLDPDVITGYNIWGFDWKYIYFRALNGNGGSCKPYHELMFKTLSRTLCTGPDENPKVKFVEKELRSSALGQNFLYYIDIQGIVQIDLFKLIQKDYNLTSYKLDAVAEKFMGLNKEDLKPNQIFENFRRGTSKDIKEIATYCVQDCALCNKLLNKLQAIPNNVAMGNVCSIPFSYLFLRGQGIKIFSLVVKQCTEEGFLIKVLSPEDIDQNSYEGAIVFVPEPGLYTEPVAVMDYASLYPSSMIAENISHDSCVGFKEYYIVKEVTKTSKAVYELRKNTIIEKYDNLPDYNYVDIEYDIYQGIDKDKKKVGYKICRFAEKKTGEKSVLPRIEMALLKARRDTRSKIKYKIGVDKDGKEYLGLLKEENGIYTFRTVEGHSETVNKNDIIELKDKYNDFQKAVLDGQQLAFKVTCNSLYGQVGASTSSICFKELAASTTATGRKMVLCARDYTLEKFKGSKLVYGDSVLGDEPILLKDIETDQIVIKTIETLGEEWEDYENFKPFDNGRNDKQKCKCDKYLVWSNNGWTKIKKVIRHKTNKKIYKVSTRTGIVCVTEDHSLLNEKGDIIKPKDLKINKTKLLSGYPNVIINRKIKFKDHTTVWYKIKGKLEASQLVLRLRQIGYKVRIRSDIKLNTYYIEGYLSKTEDESFIIDCMEIGKINEDVYVYDLETEEGNFQAGIGNIIVKNTDSVFINFTDYIKKEYSKNYPNGKIDDREMMRLTIEVGKEAGKYVTSKLKKPQDLEYEKVFWPFMIFSKKRYVGNKYEYSPDKFKQTSMGIVLKRRDNAPIVKEVYNGIIDYLMNKRDIKGSYEFFREKVKELLDGKVDISKLVISKSLKADYSNPTTIPHKMLADRIGERDPGNKPQSNDRLPYCFIDVSNLKCKKCGTEVDKEKCKCVFCMDLYCKTCLINHHSMCRNLCRFCKKPEKKLDNGKMSITQCPICTGYYCKYCFHKHKKRKDKYGVIHMDKCKKQLSTKLIQGDIVEDPDYIKENDLMIDYIYYLERQIEKPVFQIFELFRKDPEKLVEDLKMNYSNKRLKKKTITDFFGYGIRQRTKKN